jgi:hypothetical protein
MLFMLPQEQARLRECMTHRSLLDELLDLADEHAGRDWFQRNARLFLEVCELFGAYAGQHHDLLVRRFIEQPAESVGQQHLAGLTASGPPLPALIGALELLRDLRRAAPRADVATRHHDLERLRRLLDCHAAALD